MQTLVDPSALWQSLPQDAKDKLGSLAIAQELALQSASSDRLDLGVLLYNEKTANECYGEISDLIATHLSDKAFDDTGEPFCPDLNKLGIRQCNTCGCTENNGCITQTGPCTWSGPAICSSCAPRAA